MCDIILSLKNGLIRGTSSRDYHGGSFYSFLGIPYAKAPVGELRFKAPEPVESWTGIKDCTKNGIVCPSIDVGFIIFTTGKEDNCLNLNVFTKKLPITQNFIKKPVMVFIHGGAFTMGSNEKHYCGPEFLMTEDIVLVVINYRLGMLGFLSLEDQSLEVPGNAGLKDMVLSLKWVNKNIAEFGGDPNNVTIFGISAGGAAVQYLTLSPLSNGLFHKAIIQSGSVLNNWAFSNCSNSSYAAHLLGCTGADEKTVLAKLRRMSARNVVRTQMKVNDIFRPSILRPWGPVIEPPSETAFLSEHPLDIMRSGRQHKVPIIIGYTAKEGTFLDIIKFIHRMPTDLSLTSVIPHELGLKKDSQEFRNTVASVKEFYFSDEASLRNEDLHRELNGDIHFGVGIQQSAEIMAKSSTEPIYMYRFYLNSRLNCFQKICMPKYRFTTVFFYLLVRLSYFYCKFLKPIFLNIYNKLPTIDSDGSGHADDMFHLFNSFFTPKIEIGSDADIYVQRFVKLWTNFARTGNPTPKSDAYDNVLEKLVWKPINKTDGFDFDMLELGKDLKMIKNLDVDRIRFWNNILVKKYK